MTRRRQDLIIRLLVCLSLYYLFYYTQFFYEICRYPEHVLYELGLKQAWKVLYWGWSSLSDVVVGLSKTILSVAILWNSVALLLGTVRKAPANDGKDAKG